MKYFLSLLMAVILFPTALLSQEHNHSHGRNEIGISPGATYSPSHDEWGFGVHAHYFRTLGEHSPWALGASLEQIYAHGSHWTVSAGAKYTLFDKLNLAVMPGITFFKHGDEERHPEEVDHEHTGKARFSVHFEVVYDLIHWENFHLGPAVDYSWSKHDTHFMVGVHCAYSF